MSCQSSAARHFGNEEGRLVEQVDRRQVETNLETPAVVWIANAAEAVLRSRNVLQLPGVAVLGQLLLDPRLERLRRDRVPRQLLVRVDGAVRERLVALELLAAVVQ